MCAYAYACVRVSLGSFGDRARSTVPQSRSKRTLSRNERIDMHSSSRVVIPRELTQPRDLDSSCSVNLTFDTYMPTHKSRDFRGHVHSRGFLAAGVSATSLLS